ncbi:hypothetical protein Lalb_Chr19g0130911 [Lupinus albus]|uniref:Uncharacterized protein n=1 Tax=Lupinus albus TaxID=3870 RepID=A0A6A4NKI8_LUPAL|nr:hypothetical protein Lalb_Chr19g0130911 [Lupinus albus]
MRVHKSTVLTIMFFLFILALLLHLSSYWHTSWVGKEDMGERTRTRFLFSFPHTFGTTSYHAAEIKDNKVSGFHTVSLATTPGGPNPLHN